MNTKSKCSCHCHNCNSDSHTIHINSCTKRNGYRISISVQSHLFTDFHVYRNISCGTSCKESCQRTSLQALENQRIWILADAPVNQKRIGHKIDKQHTSYKKKQQFSISRKDIQTVCRYCVKYQTKNSKRCKINDPGYYHGNTICNISQNLLCHLISCTKSKPKKNSPHQDPYIVCIYQ